MYIYIYIFIRLYGGYLCHSRRLREISAHKDTYIKHLLFVSHRGLTNNKFEIATCISSCPGALNFSDGHEVSRTF